MKIRIYLSLLFLAFLGILAPPVSAQVNSVVGQVTSSPAASIVSGISGDGRFIVFESTGNVATENPRNSDGNLEIFIFDYAQRRIFQITDTKNVLIDPTMDPINSNTRVQIVNTRPVLSNDGRWIAFASNATTSTPTAGINGTNPGSFDGNTFTGTTNANPLENDANTEIWLYNVPATAPASLTTGAEIAITNLAGGPFIQATNSDPSNLPAPGSTTELPYIPDDNRDASISDTGGVIAFTSNRDLVPAIGNAFPADDNDEIFTFTRATSVLGQVTRTPRGTVQSPIFNFNATMSGTGSRVVFASKANNPVVGMTGGTNSDNNLEIFYADINAAGSPAGTQRQITNTTVTNAGDILNILSVGRRMSRDGRYIAFDSFADLANENTGTNQTSFALYLFDSTDNSIRRVGPRSTADDAAFGGDINHYPGFTNYNGSGAAQTLTLAMRQNILPDGTIAANNDDGLNPDATRPAQIFSYPLNVAPAMATFTRISRLPTGSNFTVGTQPIPSNSASRIAFNLPLSEIGTGNGDLLAEVYYLFTPVSTTETASNISFATGATRIPVSPVPVPTPSPTPTPSPSPSPSPTPQTPPAVQGISPGMLAIVNYDSGINFPIQAVTAVGSLNRRFTLPIQLSGVTMTINGLACGLQRVGRREILFVAPPALSVDATTGITYPVVINNNGVIIKGSVTMVTARPDIFTYSFVDSANNTQTNRARVFNATNRVLTREPFTVTTLRYRGGRRVPTVLRLYLTGIEGAPATVMSIRLGEQTITGSTSVLTPATLVEPGVYTVDFQLPDALNGAGEVPVVFTITFGSVFQSRLDDTAPFIKIL